ncbi:MAG: 4,5-DOPA dioxygenase extradiol [Alphaproteobacteria bacterium]|nr:4,5-DOPA dioxygenase extradiol [Alphaproteobacteria bacterium]
MKMPVVFVGHGSPMNIIEENEFTEGWKEIAKKIPKPTAVLCISAHWFTQGQKVSTNPVPETIYDFYGFPDALYQITYPAKGSIALAEKVADLLGGKVEKDSSQGLDHGAWSVLKFMFPEADVPVVQLSVNRANSPQASFELGMKLRKLREEGVLILGSGDVVHNLRLIDWNMPNGGYVWANSFDEYIKKAVKKYDVDDVIDYQNAGEEEQKSFYFRDHYDPLLYCLGAVDAKDKAEVYNDKRVLGSLSMTSYVWKSKIE